MCGDVPLAAPNGSALPLVTRALPYPANGLPQLAPPPVGPCLGHRPPQASPLGAALAGQVLPWLQGNRWGKFGEVMRSSGGNGYPPLKGNGERSGVAGAWLAEAPWAGPPRSLRLPHLSFRTGGRVLLCCTGDQGTGLFSPRGWA